MATKVYVGNLDTRITERELEDEFIRFGTLRSVWVARKPPGFAFVEFEDVRDAEDAVRKLDKGPQGWRVEFSRKDRGPPRGGPRDDYRGGGGGYGGGGGGGYGGGGGGMRSEMKCYECGEMGHFARDCRNRGGGGGGGGGGRRGRSPSPVRRDRSPRRRSPSYEPQPRRSPSYEPRDRSEERSPAAAQRTNVLKGTC